MTVSSDPGQQTPVAVIGTSIMAAAMARNLVRAGQPTTVWDRSAAATAPLADEGAMVAQSVAEAIGTARVVITMLPTADVVTSVVLDSGASEAFSPGAGWAQMGTIGVTATTQISLRLAASRPDVLLADAPVSGSKGPAEAGRLLILVSGPPDARPVLEPVLRPPSRLGIDADAVAAAVEAGHGRQDISAARLALRG